MSAEESAPILRHYTDEVGRADIAASGRIMPGIDGLVYLTPDLYESAAEARARLSLPQPPTGFFQIPAESLPDASEIERVPARHGEPGGGFQVWVDRPVQVPDLGWVPVR